MRRSLLAAAVVALGLGGSVWPAQAFEFASQGQTLPIEVTADDGIEWRQDGQVFIARGNARAARGDVTISADTLTAHYRQTPDGESEIWRLDADGAVTIATATETATGSNATYNIDDAVLVLVGQPARLVTADEEVIAHESLEYWEAKRLAVARGKASLIAPDRRLDADVITADLAEETQAQRTGNAPQPGTGGLRLKVARGFGNVVVSSQRERASADRGSYDAETGIAELIGSVRLSRDDNHLAGGYATMNLNTGVSRLFPAPPGGQAAEGRVRGVFVPEARRELREPAEQSPQSSPAPTTSTR
ncbi:LptA/OstA family protein [Telmatospirillum sp. J64-1]|uniref:LptA/OstA family protein n=1 Tax=Telmatospirillum sp. J64-1 TaxID=2502183 RepID=UPI00115CA2DE|nr:LptA/OstA family protein [Telmatospirillum sp. J64-1]